MPNNSFLIIDKSILRNFWCDNYEQHMLVHELRLFCVWRRCPKDVLILNGDWESFKDEVRKQLSEAKRDNGEEIDFEKELFESVKSFAITQKYFKEEEGIEQRENLSILTNALSPLGSVILISNEHNDKLFNESIGKSKVFNLVDFMKIVKIENPNFVEDLDNEFYKKISK